VRQTVQCLFKRPGITCSPHNQAQTRSVEGMLQIRHVRRGHRFALRASLPHVANDTNDLHALQQIEGTEDGPAERTFVGKRFSDERLIHHRNEVSVRRIVVAEVASALQRFSGIPSVVNVPGAIMLELASYQEPTEVMGIKPSSSKSPKENYPPTFYPNAADAANAEAIIDFALASAQVWNKEGGFEFRDVFPCSRRRGVLTKNVIRPDGKWR
jgi:hypothetical protein